MDLNFVRGQFTEAELESAIISIFTEQGYDYIIGETIHRGFEEILLRDDLRAFLSAHYPGLTAAEIKKVIGAESSVPMTFLNYRITF